MKTEILAFYLPQFHPTPHNDEWWGKGFTEWTNVGRAKKFFPGHYQPKIPADLGYYDLRLPQVRESQAQMAREAGVTGFCYYHYWFENGKEELDMPFKEVLDSGKPDFPFCLCWANESWNRKFWNIDGTVEKEMLIEQKYPGEEDNRLHFLSLQKAFEDKRYVRIDGKPLFMIYKPFSFIRISEFIRQWNNMAKESGLNGIFFVAYSLEVDKEYSALKEMGFDAVCSCRLGESFETVNVFRHIRRAIKFRLKLPRAYDYRRVFPSLVGVAERQRDDVFPTMVPNWDHTPRSGRGGYLYVNTTPSLFRKHVASVLDILRAKPDGRKVCFIKSWNEWGEGNYMEPDLKYRHGYLDALRSELDIYRKIIR